MGLIYATIELTNTFEKDAAARGFIPKDQVRHTKVSALVDSGATLLCINENIQAQLGLTELGVETAELADGSIRTYQLVGPVTVQFENRNTLCRAVVLPGNSEVLLGAVPMQDLDVVIDPKLERMVVHPLRPYIAQKKIK
jgi:clan AA aspartic protease